MNKEKRIELIRKGIIDGAKIYSSDLAGPYYLYIFENNYFEMHYCIDNFLHLTGVGTYLNAKTFYKLAKKGILQDSQIFFNKRHPLTTSFDKSINLEKLASFIKEGYFVIKDLNTDSAFYPYTITNIDLSLLLSLQAENSHENIYVPKSIRVKGNIFNKTISKNIFEIDYILCKKDLYGTYNKLLYSKNDKLSELPDDIKLMISKDLL